MKVQPVRLSSSFQMVLVLGTLTLVASFIMAAALVINPFVWAAILDGSLQTVLIGGLVVAFPIFQTALLARATEMFRNGRTLAAHTLAFGQITMAFTVLAWIWLR